MRRRPGAVLALALALRAAALIAIVELAGTGTLAPAAHHIAWDWIALTAVAELLTYPAYVWAYRSIDRLTHGRATDMATLVRTVIVGFGPVAMAGGFGVDRAVLEKVADLPDEHRARAQVGALSSLEWAVLAPVTWGAATRLLIAGARVSGSLLWPWALGVPAAAAMLSWMTARGSRSRLPHWRGREVRWVTPALLRLCDGVDAVKLMARHPRRHAGAWTGMSLYWACEIAAFYGAVRAAQLRLDLPMAVLAYSTGYLASRRSLPLGGAGLVEVLLVYSLYQLHEPVGSAILAVLVYRVFNFVLVIIPSQIAYHQLRAGPAAVLS